MVMVKQLLSLVNFMSILAVTLVLILAETGAVQSNCSLASKSMKLDINSTLKFCFSLSQSNRQLSNLICAEDGPSLAFGNCMSYNSDTHVVSISMCPNIQSNNYTLTSTKRIRLPENFTQLNDYMCDPLSRKGTVCSECADGFGPSITPLGLNCVSCRDTRYGIPLLVCLELVPITIFYFIVWAFQISFSTAPMPCFIMYAQCIVALFYLCRFSDNVSLKDGLLTHDGNLSLDVKIIDMLYGVFNLDFFQSFLFRFCINSKHIYIVLFGYFSALYPILLITLTWISIELHGRNFRPIVWLWKPFHRCFVSLRRSWNTKNDIIDVFITFLLLSYSKCLYQTLLLLSTQGVHNYTESGKLINIQHRVTLDPTVTYGSKDHLILLVPAVIVFAMLINNLVPPLLLIFHPCKLCKSCLSKCRLNFFAVSIFVDKLQGCYRDGLEAGRDMRSLSGLYFFLRMSIYLVGYVSPKLQSSHRSLTEVWVSVGSVFFIVALFIALTKPYKLAHMNYLDTLLLSNLALMPFLFAARFPYMLHIAKVLLLSPIIGMLLIIFYNKLGIKSSCLKLKNAFIHKFKQVSSDATSKKSISDEENQPLLLPVNMQ